MRELVSGRPLVVLCATDMEAAPMEAALESSREVVMATKRIVAGELPVGVVLAVTGCDKANAAHVATLLLEHMKPRPLLVLQTGIAGAFPDGDDEPTARPGDIVLATRESYSDTGSSSPSGWLSAAELGLPLAQTGGIETGGTFVLDRALVDAAALILREAIEEAETREAGGPPGLLAGRRLVVGPFVTSSLVSGTRAEGQEHRGRWGAVAESMEGAAAAHICALYGVPFLEVRGVSNMVVDRDRESWRIEEAVAAAGAAALTICRSFYRLPLVTADRSV